MLEFSDHGDEMSNVEIRILRSRSAKSSPLGVNFDGGFQVPKRKIRNCPDKAKTIVITFTALAPLFSLAPAARQGYSSACRRRRERAAETLTASSKRITTGLDDNPQISNQPCFQDSHCGHWLGSSELQHQAARLQSPRPKWRLVRPSVLSSCTISANLPSVDLSGINASRSLFNLTENDASSTPNTERTTPARTRGPSPAHSDGGATALSQRLSADDGAGFKKLDRIRVENEMKSISERGDLARQSTRRWKEGEAYAPHDLSFNEMIKWKKPKQPTKDVFDLLGLNPLDHYKVRCGAPCMWKPRLLMAKRRSHGRYGVWASLSSLRSSLWVAC